MENWITMKKFAGFRSFDRFGKELCIQAQDAGTSETEKTDAKAPANCHILFRRRLYLPENISVEGIYRIKITADDYYKLSINGRFVGQGPAAAYSFVYHYNEYDITDYLISGENVIAVHTYYQGVINRVFNSGDNRTGMWAEIEKDGVRIAASDADWKAAVDRRFPPDAECTGYQTQFLEDIDARLEEKGWKLPGFDDTAWENAVLKADDDHRLVSEPSVPLTVREIRAEHVTRFPVKRTDDKEEFVPSVHFLLDFGREVTGCVRLRAPAKSGGRVKVLCAEELTEDGHARYELRCNLRYEELWTLSGADGGDEIENYDYKGFRYVEILAEDGTVGPDGFSVLLRHYPVKERRKPVIRDELLSRVWDICENGVIIGTQEAFLDCPTREKGQYLGDLTVTALSHYYITGDYAMYKKALKDFADTRFICPGLLAVAPGGLMQEIADFSLLYPLQLQNYYRISGDAEFVRQMLPIADGVVAYFSKYRREDGLLSGVTEKWNLVDWPQNLRDDYDFPLTKPVGEGCHNVINAYYYGAMKIMNELSAEFGFPEKYDTKSFRTAFYKEFYNGKTFTDRASTDHCALHSNVLPLFYQMVEPEETGAIRDLIMEKGFSCGVFFSYFVLKALTKNGYKREALELMKGTGEHSWHQMLKEGATSCFEAWGKDQKWNTSLCHPWASAPIIVLSEDFAEETI